MALLAVETEIILGNLYFGLLYVALDSPVFVSLHCGNISSILKML